MEMADIDLLNVYTFAERVISLAEYRVTLQNYLHTKMGLVAPNLQSLIGDQVCPCVVLPRVSYVTQGHRNGAIRMLPSG